MEMYAMLFIVLVGISYAQEVPQTPLEVKFADSQTRHVTSDGSLSFVCNINRDLLFVIEHMVEIIRKPAVGESEVVLAQAGKIIGDGPDFYKVKVTPSVNSIKVEFEIVKVRDVDEGLLICRAYELKTDGARDEDEVEIIVQRPLDSLLLKFGTYDAITKDKVDPIEIDSGKHTVACIAEGSNPAPNEVHLYLDDKLIEGVHSKTSRMETDVIKYRTTITGDVDLTVSNSRQEFRCTAISPLGVKHSVKLPIKINVYDPKIVCNDSETYLGKRYPYLTCIVDYEGLDIKGFKYELGSTGEVYEGQQNKDFVIVTREQLSESKARVVLNLYEAKEWHFQTEFYLVVEHKDGHITRESVRLREVPGNTTMEISEQDPNDSSSVLSASVAMLVISLWCSKELLV